MAEQYTEADIDAMTRTVLGEALSEGYEGQVAVAHVILNRLKENPKHFGSSPYDVAHKKGSKGKYEFSAWNDPKEEGNRWVDLSADSVNYKKAREAVEDVVYGRVSDPTGGAVMYYSPTGLTNQKGIAPHKRKLKEYQDRGVGSEINIGRHRFQSPLPLPKIKPTPPRVGIMGEIDERMELARERFQPISDFLFPEGGSNDPTRTVRGGRTGPTGVPREEPTDEMDIATVAEPKALGEYDRAPSPRGDQHPEDIIPQDIKDDKEKLGLVADTGWREKMAGWLDEGDRRKGLTHFGLALAARPTHGVAGALRDIAAAGLSTEQHMAKLKEAEDLTRARDTSDTERELTYIKKLIKSNDPADKAMAIAYLKDLAGTTGLKASDLLAPEDVAALHGFKSPQMTALGKQQETVLGMESKSAYDPAPEDESLQAFQKRWSKKT